MFNISEFTLVGRFFKTHGNNGDIVIKTDILDEDILDDIEFLFANIENGLVPFEVQKASIRNSDMVQFSLSSLESEVDAKKLLGIEVYIETELMAFESDELPSQIQINQFSVYDKKLGLIGQVNDMISIDKNPLLQILVGKQEILIPFTEDFIESTDYDKKEIHMILPEGLMDINL